MSTVNITFTANAGGITLGGTRTFGAPAELASADFQKRESVAWAVADEFNTNGTTSGSVTVTAA